MTTHKCPDLSQCHNIVDHMDSEIRYQNDIAEQRAKSGSDSLAGGLTVLAELVSTARWRWVGNRNGSDAALDVVREIAASALRILMIHGCPSRFPKDLDPVLPDKEFVNE